MRYNFYPSIKPDGHPKWLLIILVIIMLLAGVLKMVWAEDNWLLTAYCPCKICCGKTDGITASGKIAKYGYVAGNWLPFGTEVKIEGLGVFEVQDRGAKSLFGSKKNHIKHLDIFFPTHKQALRFGKQYRNVEVLK